MFELTKDANGIRRGAIDASWYQGRGAFGGLVGGLLLTAMRDAVGDETRPVRSATFHFAGPATAGPFSIATEIMRSGSRVTHATARLLLERDGEGKGEGAAAIAAFASASFGATRASEIAYATARMPAIAAPEALAPLPADFPGAPAFLRHFDVRFGGPSLPFSGSPEPGVAAWVRPKRDLPLDAAAAVLLVDALPPAVCALFTSPRPIASVDFRVDFLARLPPATAPGDSGDFHLVSIASRWAGDGYTEELRELWNRGGSLIAQCRQLIALL